MCAACANTTAGDTSCKSAYSTGTICLAGVCTTGDCHDDSTDCSEGRICGSSVPHACGDCTTGTAGDTQCTQDARYGTGHLCENHLCVSGNCHDSTQCTGSKAGQVCGATTAHTCGACTGDTQCANDATYGTAKPICETTAGAAKIGQCVANPATTGSLCTISSVVTNSVTCPVNSADFCCGGKCVAGNCCVDADCTSLGANFNCLQNTCTQCNSVVGGAYFVDPINGDDTGATGSNMSGTSPTPGCSFRTLKQALTVIGAPTTATTITIVCQSASTTALATGESFPITVPANVTIKTKTGPVKVTVPASKTGFKLNGDTATIQPNSAAPLTIDGASNASNIGIEVAPGTGSSASLSYITVTNTGGDGILVTSGTATLGAGISVTDAGANGINISDGTATINAGLSVIGANTNGIKISGTGAATIGAGVSVTNSGATGLDISGSGTAAITVTTATAASTVFDHNTLYGIAVAGTGVLTITGAIPTSGTAVRTVSAKNNTGSNVYFTSTAAAVSAIKNFYSYGSGEDGMQIAVGSKVQVRHSVFRKNAGDGIHIVGATGSLASIDLGTDATSATDAGNNELQSAVTANKNTGAGICVQLTGTGTPTLNARGNQFANIDCTTSTGAITKNATCASGIDLGITASAGLSVTVDSLGCTYTH